MFDTICLKGMKFHTLIGIYPHEMELKQPVEVDLAVNYLRNIGVSQGVIDYANLHSIVSNIVSQGHIDYIENLAEQIASKVLLDSQIVETTVCVRKPNVTLPGPLDYAEIKIVRTREMYEEAANG